MVTIKSSFDFLVDRYTYSHLCGWMRRNSKYFFNRVEELFYNVKDRLGKGSPAICYVTRCVDVFACIALFVLVTASLSGCGADDVQSVAQSSSNAESLGTRSESPSFDFGWVSPKTELVHEFIVKNHSAKVWELSNVKTTCGCTTAEPSQSVLQPGDDLIVPVLVKSAEGKGNRSQRVVLDFANDVPDQVLTVLYAIRAPLSVNPEASHLSLVPGQKDQFTLTIENYSDVTCDNVDITAGISSGTAQWMFIRQLREDVRDERTLPIPQGNLNIPRQRWTALIDIDTELANLLPGDHHGLINIVAQAKGQELKNQVVVNLSLNPRIRVIPQNLLIIDSGEDQDKDKSLIFRFADTERIPKTGDIHLNHDLPLDLKLECSKPNGNTMSGVLSAAPLKDIRGTIRGQATIQFGEPVNESVPISITIVDRRPREGAVTENPGESQ